MAGGCALSRLRRDPKGHIDFGNAVNKIRLLKSEAGVTGFAIGTQVHRLQLVKPKP